MRLDPTAVELRRIGLGMPVKDLKDAATISDETWQRILKGEEIWMDSAVDVQNALGVKSLLEITHPAKLAELTGMVTGAAAGPGLPDWQMEEPLSGRIETSNGLKYFTWKLKHRFEGNRFARGKRYDLSPLPTEEQKRLNNYLTRHGEVCNRVGGHPRFPRHLTTVPDPSGQSWWVVDEWIPGTTLAQVVLDGKFQREMLAPVMRQIAEGLKALHAAEVIRRELSPRFVLLRGESDGKEATMQVPSVVLTDFELGKLFDGSPTVGRNWPMDLYRAPEIGDEPLSKQDKHVDFYSWGRIVLHLACGGLPKLSEQDAWLDSANLPSKVREITKRCLSIDVKDRPCEADEVLKAIRYWR